MREERRLTVFENKVLRRIFGPKKDEVTREWRKLQNVEFNDLYCSLNIVNVMKLRRMRWAGHVARMGGPEEYTELWWGNLREGDYLGDPGVHGRIILTLRRLMSYIYGAPILDVSRSHTTTQHSR